ncbi:MAG: hypothetical protein O7C59_02040 [Rickettsia endosymbiont of Ixodes persulcatus]|nr:hypothetical protein [Rickettsia endosymbiont of Ixodes persulcatus]
MWCSVIVGLLLSILGAGFLVVVVFEGMVAVITVFTCFVVCIIEVGGLRFASGGLKWIRSLLLFLMLLVMLNSVGWNCDLC